MLISVDLPAPFSPTMPVIEPGETLSETSRFAWTAPKRFSMWRNSMADGGGVPPPAGTAPRRLASVSMLPPRPARYPALGGTAIGFHVVLHLDLAGNDIGLCLFHLGLHVGGDQLLVVLIDRPIDATFL